MKWSDYGVLGFVLWRARLYLPFQLRNLVYVLDSYAPTKSQLESIIDLGRNIGLDGNEIYAAVPSSMEQSGLVVRRKMTLFSALITIIIIVLGSFLLLVMTGNNPVNSPTTTYTPGSLYGSISPNDFIGNT